jgi:hypothetical protein
MMRAGTRSMAASSRRARQRPAEDDPVRHKVLGIVHEEGVRHLLRLGIVLAAEVEGSQFLVLRWGNGHDGKKERLSCAVKTVKTVGRPLPSGGGGTIQWLQTVFRFVMRIFRAGGAFSA